MYFDPPDFPRIAAAQRTTRFALIVGLHALIFGLALAAATRPELQKSLEAVTVRLIELQPEIVKPEPSKPQPKRVTRSAPPVLRKPVVTPPPLLVARQNSPIEADFAVAPQPPPEPIEAAAPAPVAAPPAPIVAARFDASYLQNPKPVYPAISRRLGEEGRVVFRVRVSEHGLPLIIETYRSSGVRRLDDAARAAIEHWRFAPATQGGEAIEAWVLVPMLFRLDS